MSKRMALWRDPAKFEAQVDPETIVAARTAVLAELLELLRAFIGEKFDGAVDSRGMADTVPQRLSLRMETKMKAKNDSTKRKLRKNVVSQPAKVTIRKLPTGVPGLDEILGGGIPELSFNIIAGTPRLRQNHAGASDRFRQCHGAETRALFHRPR